MLSLFLVNGLVLAGTYAILAAGFNLIFGVARIMNFSHTGLYMMGAFMMYIFIALVEIPLFPSIILAIFAPTLLAVLFYQFFIDRVKEHEYSVIILTVALVMLIQEGFLLKFGGSVRGIPVFIEGYADIIGIRVSYQHLLSLIICVIVLIGLGWLLTRTKLGNAIRAVSQNTEVSNLMGINVSTIQIITVGLSAILAGIAAVVMAPLFSIEPYMWSGPLIIILAAVVVGGLGSIKGCIIGATILAFIEVGVVSFLPSGGYLRGVVSLLAMVLVLIFKPEGLFGIVFEEERL
jgi:branched-chain amino acid transport system permease protein